MLKNNRFDKRIVSISAEIWSKITKIDEMKGQWTAGARLSPQALGRLKQSVLITSTGASTRIEGAKLSDEDIEKMMRGLSVQKFTDRDVQEVKGYYELLNNVFDSWKHIKFKHPELSNIEEIRETIEKPSIIKQDKFDENFNYYYYYFHYLQYSLHLHCC